MCSDTEGHEGGETLALLCQRSYECPIPEGAKAKLDGAVGNPVVGNQFMTRGLESDNL